MRTSSDAISADETILRMREALQVASDLDLAKSLSVSKQTVSAWRRRNSVPKRYVIEVAARTMSSVEHFLDPAIPRPVALRTYGTDNEAAYGLCIVFYEKVRSIVSIGDEFSTAMWWGAMLPHLVEYYEYELHSACVMSGNSVEHTAFEIADGIKKMSEAETVRLLNARLFPVASRHFDRSQPSRSR